MYSMTKLAFSSQTTKEFLRKIRKNNNNKDILTNDPPSLQTQKADLSVSSKTVYLFNLLNKTAEIKSTHYTGVR